MRIDGTIAHHPAHQPLRQANLLARLLIRWSNLLARATDGLAFLERDRSLFTKFANRHGKAETKPLRDGEIDGMGIARWRGHHEE
jgi:hypothetical protein